MRPMPLSEVFLRRPSFLWQQPGWPDLQVDAVVLAPALDSARLEQGRLLGLLDAIGWWPAQEIARELWVQEALATAHIEGQQLDLDAVRSSVARRLGLDDDAPAATNRSVEGLVDVMQDAVERCSAPLDADRLWRWQSALFPGGTSGIARIAVGQWREHADPMQIVSGPLGREVVHYEAPPSHLVPSEMARFLEWFESTRPAPGVQRGAEDLNGLVRQAVDKAAFRARMVAAPVNPRQAKVLERLLAAGSVELGGGFLGGLTADKYTRLASTSKPTATRDLGNLVNKGLLHVTGQGKGTRYAIAVPGWTQPVVDEASTQKKMTD